MSAHRRFRLPAAIACASCLLAAGYVQAQQAQQQLQPGQFGQPLERADAQQSDQNLIQDQSHTTHFRGPDAAGSAAAGSVQSVDGYLANCLLIKNNAEIKLTEFAESRIQNPQIKQFAQQLVQDHQQIAERLRKAANDRGTAGQAAQAATAANSQGLNELLQIDRQITDKCASMAREKLAQKSGEEFDKCFVGMQVGNHMQMLAALEVIAQQTDGQLQQTAKDAKSKVQQHLQQAEGLMKQLESDNANARQAQTQ